MKRFISFLLVCLPFLVASAQGESRDNPIKVTGNMSTSLLGKPEFNTTTWFLVTSDAFDQGNLLNIMVSGGNYGDIIVSTVNGSCESENVFLTTEGLTVMKYLWDNSRGDLLVAISQDNAGGQVQFTITKANAGEVRRNALEAVLGENIVPAEAGNQVWYHYTATSDAIVKIQAFSFLSNVLDASGLVFCPKSLIDEGFRMQDGQEIYFQIENMGGEKFQITTSEIPVGHYSDKPLDITDLSLFKINIPVDPTASTDGAAQSERYWLYKASENGLLMWGTDDGAWTSGSWGASIVDQTTGKRLNTPLTAVQAGMVTYTISVEAGHDYLIAQTIGHAKTSRDVNVYVAFTTAKQGETKDDPMYLTLNEPFDMGRESSVTHYYLFTAPVNGHYTAMVHAGGQVRATTPRDGSWNIGRDYSNQELQMHVDNNIFLAQGESLLLEVTLTSDIDIHTNGSDASKPNYYILMTLNDSEDEKPARDGEEIVNAIVAQENTPYMIWQNGSEEYYPRYYSIKVPADTELEIKTQHSEAIGSPLCLAITLDDQHWNGVKYTNELISGTQDMRYVGRRYIVDAISEARVIYVYVEGVSFLYEGATWQYKLIAKEDKPADEGDQDAIHSTNVSATSAVLYGLDGRRLQHPVRHGFYISNGRKVIR